ncbi:hypothetical protein SUNI508_00216 [Seiridium unicorne]|uniref:Glycoside hydrolase family 105 protein n=1 Tax=Seiridium unicorne TaxID=138068 RepID=A0ABR2VJK2_9PEZI
MRVQYHLVAAAALSLQVASCGASYALNSSRMAASIMSRRQGIMTGAGGSSELLQAGFTQKAFTAFVSQYPSNHLSPAISKYIKESAASVVPFVLNATNDALSYPLDRLSNGNALLALSNSSSYGTAGANQTQYRQAADALRRSIDLNRRNYEGGLWYFVYPEWSYLDGMYSLAPFYTLYSTTVGYNGTALEDVQLQLDLLWQHTRNASSGLLVHGYDASRTAVWADPVTGASPHVWDRSLGWFAMALIDSIELLPASVSKYSKLRQRLHEMIQALAGPLIEAADSNTGAWWQVMDEPGRAGNYIESSGSAMFSYALLKSARLGLLSAEVAVNASIVGKRAQQYLTDAFVVKEANGTLGYNGTVSVCSLNSTASYEYYVGQPINYNSILGSAAYILASLEVERLKV